MLPTPQQVVQFSRRLLADENTMRALYRTINLHHRDIRPDADNQPSMALQQDEEGFFSIEVDGPHVVNIVTSLDEQERAQLSTHEPERVAYQKFEFPSHAQAARFLNQTARAEDEKAWDGPGGSFITSVFWMGRKVSPSAHDIIELSRPVNAPLMLTCPSGCGHSAAQHAAFDRGLRAGEDGADAEDLPHEYRGDFGLTEDWLTGLSIGQINANSAAS